MKAILVIPARYHSQRLPGKPLRTILEKPMIQWVYEKCKAISGVSDTWVATDDKRIASHIESIGGKVMMTSPDCQSGTDRVAEVARSQAADVVINVQGDEPTINPQVIEKTLALVSSGKFQMATAAVPLRSHDELVSPHVVKVLIDDHDRAIYFSRYPIPYSRIRPTEVRDPEDYCSLRHVGLYVYRKDLLLKLSALKPSDMEMGESLEQLRAMQAGVAIGVARVDFPAYGVDTEEDLEKVKEFLK